MSQPSMRDHIDAMEQQAFARLDSMNNNEILSKSVDDWIDDFVGKFASPNIPKILPDQVSRSTVPGEVPQHAVPNPNLEVMCPGFRG